MKTTERKKIAYFSINDPLDKRSWSGITYYLGQTLQKNIGSVDFLGPVPIPWVLDKALRGMAKFTRLVFKTEYIPKYSLLKNIYASLYLQWKMAGRHYDFLLAPAAASELAYCGTKLPIIYFGDATYKLYSSAYKKEFHNLNSFSKWEGNFLEKRALRKSSLVVFTSQWARQSAISDYGVQANKIEIMQFGANIDAVPPPHLIFRKQENSLLTLFFLSVDWERKGGDIAFDTLQCLLNQGIAAKLIVCGCIPPPEFAHPNLVVIPFLNKNNAADFEAFVDLFASVHFLLLPTRADCTPVVNSEANAYGVPVITTDVGGVADTVIDGVNGYCLPLEADGQEYAALIAKLYADKDAYQQLVISSRAKFEEELNWDKWAENFEKILAEHQL
ncbi:glycosyltransferase [Hymenobacter sp. HMF4947]|uniref:Glycosyltransferase n=1 Tax=Hymenobacter ginkgonis TaxID=2682976 RepID=A0A7K1TCQ3_9BACT|nr:glycosyltransferase family 4 protein [Hymenobacter ginkgonis]MVN76155.1 glycosyltransferase [Hymenobacter ginkgonis]